MGCTRMKREACIREIFNVVQSVKLSAHPGAAEHANNLCELPLHYRTCQPPDVNSEASKHCSYLMLESLKLQACADGIHYALQFFIHLLGVTSWPGQSRFTFSRMKAWRWMNWRSRASRMQASRMKAWRQSPVWLCRCAWRWQSSFVGSVTPSGHHRTSAGCTSLIEE